MATVTIQITAAGNTVGPVKTISAAHLLRFLAAYKFILGKVPDGGGGLRDMTDDECVIAWANGLLNGTKANVLNAEKTIAAKTATDTQTEITFT